MSLQNQTDQVALENHQMHLMPLEANQILPLHQTDQAQLKATSQGLQAPSLRLQGAQELPSLDLDLGHAVHPEVLDLGQVVRVLVQAVRNLGLRALNLVHKVQNLDHKALNLNRKVLNLDHNHIPQNHTGLKVDPGQVAAALKVENLDLDRAVLLQDQKVQWQDKMWTAVQIRLT